MTLYDTNSMAIIKKKIDPDNQDILFYYLNYKANV